jgi:NAD-dependent SIR2 family protein deacetylase
MIRVKTCKYCKEYFKQDSNDKDKELICPSCRPKPKRTDIGFQEEKCPGCENAKKTTYIGEPPKCPKHSGASFIDYPR